MTRAKTVPEILGKNANNADLARAHRQAAERLLARSGSRGRLEALNRLATMATAHATLALAYQTADPRVVVMEDEDDGAEMRVVEDVEGGEEVEDVASALEVLSEGVCCSKGIGKRGGRHFGPCTN
jgi:hypothetical protein